MFSAFGMMFLPDERFSLEATNEAVAAIGDESVRELLSRFGGKSFNKGIYRIIAPSSVAYWNGLVQGVFPDFSGRITCFGFDWLGRIFALDASRLEDKRPGVVLFEPGTGESLEIPCNIESFHEKELLNYREEALAESFFRDWLAAGGLSPNLSQCVGYKKPLFLGGGYSG
ncbi:DUF1851 domain-containing protein [Pseudomonas corrugata]